MDCRTGMRHDQQLIFCEMKVWHDGGGRIERKWAEFSGQLVTLGYESLDLLPYGGHDAETVLHKTLTLHHSELRAVLEMHDEHCAEAIAEAESWKDQDPNEIPF